VREADTKAEQYMTHYMMGRQNSRGENKPGGQGLEILSTKRQGSSWDDGTLLDFQRGGGYMNEWVCQNSQKTIHRTLQRVNLP
jgi:hypothetical protein